jgi:manganese/zinc/iron transport system substrate-binding protein
MNNYNCIYQLARMLGNPKSFFWNSLKLGIILGTLLTGHTTSSYAKSPLKIVATTSILGDAIQSIVGDQAQIIKLMGPGVDPHAYKATPKNIQDLSHADIIFYNGLHLEGKMADVLANFSKRKPVYAASDGIDPTKYLGDLKATDAIDPHIWFDISLWRQAVAYMSTQLQLIDPPAAAYYQENTTKYLQILDKLHEEVTELIKKIPPRQRVLITAHDAFSYFGKAYNIEVKGLQGISTVEECGLRDITNLVDYIIHRRIKAIFPENSVPSKPLRAVVEGCRKKGHVVMLGTELYSDALGEENTPEGTYVGMIMSNVKTIVEALQ